MPASFWLLRALPLLIAALGTLAASCWYAHATLEDIAAMLPRDATLRVERLDVLCAMVAGGILGVTLLASWVRMCTRAYANAHPPSPTVILSFLAILYALIEPAALAMVPLTLASITTVPALDHAPRVAYVSAGVLLAIAPAVYWWISELPEPTPATGTLRRLVRPAAIRDAAIGIAVFLPLSVVAAGIAYAAATHVLPTMFAFLADGHSKDVTQFVGFVVGAIAAIAMFATIAKHEGLTKEVHYTEEERAAIIAQREADEHERWVRDVRSAITIGKVAGVIGFAASRRGTSTAKRARNAVGAGAAAAAMLTTPVPLPVSHKIPEGTLVKWDIVVGAAVAAFLAYVLGAMLGAALAIVLQAIFRAVLTAIVVALIPSATLACALVARILAARLAHET